MLLVGDKDFRGAFEELLAGIVNCSRTCLRLLMGFFVHGLPLELALDETILPLFDEKRVP